MHLASAAIHYVRSKMSIGATDKIEDVLRSYGASIVCVLATRSVNVTLQKGTVDSDIFQMAAKAEHVGCGNCGEQAALAFVHLHERLRARPLDFMARTDKDHAFVVIGRVSGSDAGDFHTWGKEAVVCDPWVGKAYPAREIPAKAGGGMSFRAESVSRIN